MKVASCHGSIIYIVVWCGPGFFCSASIIEGWHHTTWNVTSNMTYGVRFKKKC